MVQVPKALHEVLGRTQTPPELALVALAAVGLGGGISIAGADALAAVPVWRAILAVLLIVDIAAGCAANFTRGTDLHYAERPASRWLFIAAHWHLVAIGLFLGVATIPLLLVTLFTLLAAATVNLLHGRGLQVVVGGVLMAGGLVGIALWMPSVAPLFLAATAALFVVKVTFAFAVTHHPAVQSSSILESSG